MVFSAKRNKFRILKLCSPDMDLQSTCHSPVMFLQTGPPELYTTLKL